MYTLLPEGYHLLKNSYSFVGKQALKQMRKNGGWVRFYIYIFIVNAGIKMGCDDFRGRGGGNSLAKIPASTWPKFLMGWVGDTPKKFI